ncbi:MAG: VOC family protein [Myxococcales bacterium]|nr:VOC family protein [Myxococcales bacterium]
MLPILTHVALHVRDLAACVAFYEEFCRLRVIHDRTDESTGSRVVWMSETGREKDFILVFISGGPERPSVPRDFSHLGFAVASPKEVDEVAERARAAGCLVWEPRQEPYPVGYYCGLKDPDGQFVEFSYGQPLGPGAPDNPDPS